MIIEKIITRFDGGISEDKRVRSGNKYSITKHFDSFTFPKKLVPHYKTITGAQETKARDIVKFLYAQDNSVSPGTTKVLYGLGKDTSDAKIQLYNLPIDSGSLNLADWTADNNLKSGVANANQDVFFTYKNKIYVWRSRYLMEFTLDGVTGVDDTFYDATSFTIVTQPVHHPNDDIAYFFHDNFVHSLNDTVWDDKVLTLPSNELITAATAYGNYLAIATVTDGISNADQKSTVYLWDRDSSLATLSERVDFGRGNIVHLSSLENKLIGVVNYFANSIGSGVGVDKGKVFIKQYIGGQQAITVNEFTTDDSSNVFSRTNMVKDNKLYFPMTLNLNGDARRGIWVVNSKGKLTLDFIEEEVESATLKTYEGIFATGNIWWIAHSNDGSVNFTSNLKQYSTTLASEYESLILNDGDPSKYKKLIGVEVMTEPLPTAGQIVLKYRKDEDIDGGSYTTVFTNTEDDNISHGAINVEATGANLPQYQEIQFKIESTGGAVITGLRYKYEIIDKQVF